MSRIADQIREYVNDQDVSDHFGAWGTLRPDQRRLIRRLCDVCDMFEREADRSRAEIERLNIILDAYALQYGTVKGGE